MACNPISNNVNYDCKSETALAGLKTIYAIAVEDVDTVTFGVGALEHTVTAITTLAAAKFISIKSRFETRDFTAEMNRENYNTKTEKTINIFVPGQEKETLGALNELACASKLLIIAELSNVDSATGNPKAIVAGWDKNLGADGGLLFAGNTSIETEVGGLNGTNGVFTGVGTEIVRRIEGTITVEDGAAGTPVVFA